MKTALLIAAVVLILAGFLAVKYWPHAQAVAVDPHRYPIGTTTPDWDKFKYGEQEA